MLVVTRVLLLIRAAPTDSDNTVLIAASCVLARGLRGVGEYHPLSSSHVGREKGHRKIVIPVYKSRVEISPAALSAGNGDADGKFCPISRRLQKT